MQLKSLALLLALPLVADTIELKSGEQIDGKLTETSGATVVIEVAGQPVRVARVNVKDIHIGPRSTPVRRDERSDATQALMDVRSITNEVGVSTNAYKERVIKARVNVERYLAAAASDDPAKARFSLAMSLYEFVWRSEVEDSAALKGFVEKFTNDSGKPTCRALKDVDGDVYRARRSAIWRCAEQLVDFVRREQFIEEGFESLDSPR